jgi:hypothetical protein
MKKAIFILVCSSSLFGCKKVYQCECKRIINGEDWNPIITNVAIEGTKSNASTECESLSYSLGWQDYQGCALK